MKREEEGQQTDMSSESVTRFFYKNIKHWMKEH